MTQKVDTGSEIDFFHKYFLKDLYLVSIKKKEEICIAI